jgi:hypothetical protein
MEAPPTRYRVVERDGRLIVIDTSSGAVTGGVQASPVRPGATGVAAGKGLLDALADRAAQVAGKGRDSDGRLVIAWEWTQNGQPRHWNAALDQAQQRRLGRFLLSIVAPVPLVVLTFIVGEPFIGLVASVPLILFGAVGLNRLQSETQA